MALESVIRRQGKFIKTLTKRLEDLEAKVALLENPPIAKAKKKGGIIMKKL